MMRAHCAYRRSGPAAPAAKADDEPGVAAAHDEMDATRDKKPRKGTKRAGIETSPHEEAEAEELMKKAKGADEEGRGRHRRAISSCDAGSSRRMYGRGGRDRPQLGACRCRC
jgi:hypothetical protein